MRSISLLILAFALWNISCAQSINFQVISIDTQYHADVNLNASEQLINNNTTFWEVFRGRKYTINPPRFHQKILLRRSIQETCLQSITNSVAIDSLNKTVRWRSTLKRGTCSEMKARHFVIAIQRPPSDYEILFDTVWVSASETTAPKVTEVSFSPNFCELSQVAGSPFRPLPAIITTDSLYLSYKLEDALNCMSIDFDTQIILANTYGGDCLMRLLPHAFFDPITNTLVLDVYNIYGGCRAGGQSPLAVVVPKPSQEGYSVLFQEVQVEDWEEYKMHTGGED